MNKRQRDWLGIGQQSDYVRKSIHASNISASVYISIIVITLETWMLLSFARMLIESAAAGTPRDLVWTISHGAWYVVLLGVAIALLVHAIRYLRGKTYNMRTGRVLLTLFIVVALSFGIHFGNNSYVKGEQILAFVTMTLFVFGLIIWRPLPAFVASTLTFGGFYLYINHNLPATYGTQVNLLTLWVATFVVMVASYTRQVSEASKDENIERANERLRRIASFDELTGIPNAHTFNNAVSVLFEGIEEFDIAYSILYIVPAARRLPWHILHRKML